MTAPDAPDTAPDIPPELSARLLALEAENQRLRAELQALTHGQPALGGFSSRLEKAEQALNQRNRDLQSILDNMPAMIAYWDRNLINRFGNHAYRFWFGVDPATLPGRHIREVIGEERYRLNMPYIQGALAGQAQTFERTIPVPDGTVRYSLANYVPDIVDGVVQGFYVLVSDITPLKITEAALRASEERYRAVVEDQTEVIARIHPDGRLIFVNDVYCRFFGKSATQLQEENWQPVAHPDDLPLIEARLATLSPDNPVVNVENRVYSGTGDLVWMQFVNRGFFDESGKLVEIQSVGRDITAQKLAEAALQEAHDQLERRVAERTEQLRQLALQLTYTEERERQALARDLHDELGQTLHVLKLKLGLLERQSQQAEQTQAPQQAGLIREIDTLVGDASRQVRTLTSQLCPPVLTNLGLAAALHWLCEEMAQHYALAVTCTADERPLPLLAAQKTILFRAARELLINVAKHAHTPSAAISLRQEAGQLVMTVTDQGSGFAASAATLAGTQGFGLSSVRERIGFLGGSTTIVSSPGEGVCVTLRIPLNIPPSHPMPPQETHP
ncbi:MAG TPA: PAS domain S-box protein [Azospira sp.]|nr:PAS domain S-box protein [Azospira sp.]